MKEKVSDSLQAYLTDKFASFISDERKETIGQVLNNRTKHIRVVLEDLIDSHNVNAIFRSGESLGIQHFHVIDNKQHFKLGKGVSKGSNKWIDIHRHNTVDTNNSEAAIEQLKEQGYQLFVTTPSSEANPFTEIAITKPLALVFGNEKRGISNLMKQKADQLIGIPMYGFTESFNVSVTAAILLHNFVNRMHQEVKNWQFSDQEKAKYRLLWYKKCMARPDYYHNYYVNAYEQDQSV